MKMNMRAIYTVILAMAAFSQSALAVVYPLPAGTSRLIGENLEIAIPQDSKLPLEHFAAQFQMGLSNMIEANPGVDPFLPLPGSKLIIPHQLILPDTPHEGIVVNSAEMRLYYYPKGTNTVVVLPIGIGELGKDTPVNWLTSVQRKKNGPTWTPTKAMHAEYAARGESLPEVFPAGPDNPMGLYALYVGRLYAIHGTNANFGIGLRVSHGCVRLRADDIKYLFDHVPVGTRVQFIDEPVKATVEPDGTRYLEVHNPLSSTEEQFNSNEQVPITLPVSVSKVLADQIINQDLVNVALQNRSGIPVNVSAAAATPPVVMPIAAPVGNAPAAAPDSAQGSGAPASAEPVTAPAAQPEPVAAPDGNSQAIAPDSAAATTAAPADQTQQTQQTGTVN